MRRAPRLALFLLPLFIGCSNDFDPNTATLQYELPWHKAAVNAIDFSQDGSLMATACSDGKVRVFKDENWAKPLQVEIGTEMWVHDLALSPDGSQIAVATDQQENNLHILDATTGNTLLSMPGHDGVTSVVLFSADGKMVISGGGWDSQIKFWDAKDGSLIKTLSHPTHLQSLEISPDGSQFASGTGYTGSSIRLWSLPDGELVREFTEIEGDGRSIAFSPDGKVLAGGSYSMLTLWDIKSGKVINTMEMKDWVYSLTFSPNGKWLVAGDARSGLSFYSTADWSLVKHVQAGSDVITDLAFTPDGEKLYNTGYKNAVKAWFTIKKKYVLF